MLIENSWLEAGGGHIFVIVILLCVIITAAMIVASRKFKELKRQIDNGQDNKIDVQNVYERFLIIAAHELRTPLTTILAYTDMVMVGDIDEVTLEQYIRGIKRGGLRLRLLIDQAVICMRNQPDTAPFDLAAAVESVLTRYSIWVATRRTPNTATIQYVGQRPLIVEGDIFMIETAILELIRNSVKAHSTTITVDAWRLNGNYTIVVRDNGSGMPVKVQEQLFKRHALDYLDLSDSREREGVGLGLTVVKHVVDLHKGSLEYESNAGVGTTFTIKLHGEFDD